MSPGVASVHRGRLRDRVARASSSISTQTLVSNPAASRPRSRPPAPVKSDSTLGRVFWWVIASYLARRVAVRRRRGTQSYTKTEIAHLVLSNQGGTRSEARRGGDIQRPSGHRPRTRLHWARTL